MSSICEVAKIVMSPGGEYAEARRFWQGCPTIAMTPGGRLFAGWYSGGTGEPSLCNYNLLVRSDDGGRTWSEPLLVVDSNAEHKIRAIDIQLWLDPEGRLWLFWTQRDDKIRYMQEGHLSVWAILCENPDAGSFSWSEPRRISAGFLRCQPTALSDGRYLLCSYDWTNGFYCYSESSDKGSTWLRRRGGRKVDTPFDETMVLERGDKSLWMLARSTTGFLGESFSRDGGATWTDGQSSSIVAPSSRFFLGRLRSGRTLLIHNADPVKRQNMVASISDDDGLSWKSSLLLDEREPVSYPDAAIAADGSIFIVYDRGRGSDKEILIARMAESDILNGAPVSEGAFLKKVISKAPERPYDQAIYDSAHERDRLYWEEFKEFNGIS